MILHSVVLCVPECNSLLSFRSEDGGPTSNSGTPCRADVPWQGRYTDSYGTAQLLGGGGALVSSVPSDLLLR